MCTYIYYYYIYIYTLIYVSQVSTARFVDVLLTMAQLIFSDVVSFLMLFCWTCPHSEGLFERTGALWDVRFAVL